MYVIHLYRDTGHCNRLIIAEYEVDLDHYGKIIYTLDYGWTRHEIDILQAFAIEGVTGIRIYAYGHENEEPLLELYP